MAIGNFPYGPQAVAFSATPTFDCSMGNVFSMTLTGAISSMSIVNAMAGHLYTFIFSQDGLGLHSVAWPGNFKGVVSIPFTALAGTTSVQTVVYDGTNFYGIAVGQLNL